MGLFSTPTWEDIIPKVSLEFTLQENGSTTAIFSGNSNSIRDLAKILKKEFKKAFKIEKASSWRRQITIHGSDADALSELLARVHEKPNYLNKEPNDLKLPELNKRDTITSDATRHDKDITIEQIQAYDAAKAIDPEKRSKLKHIKAHMQLVRKDLNLPENKPEQKSIKAPRERAPRERAREGQNTQHKLKPKQLVIQISPEATPEDRATLFREVIQTSKGSGVTIKPSLEGLTVTGIEKSEVLNGDKRRVSKDGKPIVKSRRFLEEFTKAVNRLAAARTGKPSLDPTTAGDTTPSRR